MAYYDHVSIRICHPAICTGTTTVYLPASASQVTAHERQQVKPLLEVGGWTTLRWLKWLRKGDYVIASRKQRDIAPEKMDLPKRKGSSSNHQFSGANC